MTVGVDIIASRKSDECGCPEEDLLVGMFDVTIHLEPDGSGEAFIDCGEWQEEKKFICSGIDDLRQQVADYIYSLPKHPSL